MSCALRWLELIHPSTALNEARERTPWHATQPAARGGAESGL